MSEGFQPCRKTAGLEKHLFPRRCGPNQFGSPDVRLEHWLNERPGHAQLDPQRRQATAFQKPKDTSQLAVAVVATSAASAATWEVFNQIALPGALTNCRRLLQPRTWSLMECLAHWMQLNQQAAEKPGFIRYAPSDEAGGCEITAWCDQLLANESEPQTTLLPESRGQPRIVLFAVKSGSRVKALDSFLSPTGCNRSLLVLPAIGQPPVDFWRSCWLDRLPDLMKLLAGKKLAVEILRAGATVLKISFDAGFAGLNLQNWFSKTRLLGSEPDLALTGRVYNVFSVVGSSNEGLSNRTFFINLAFAGCLIDAGIMAVVEKDDVCAWAMTGSGNCALPRILYNPDGGFWDSHAVLADYMLVTGA